MRKRFIDRQTLPKDDDIHLKPEENSQFPL